MFCIGGLHVFHLIWITLLLGGIFITIIYPSYIIIHKIILITTVISQVIFLGCPIVTVQNLIQRKYLNNLHEPICSFTDFLLNKFFGIHLSPIWVTCIVFTVLVCCSIFLII